jgi:hypothetical protein
MSNCLSRGGSATHDLEVAFMMGNKAAIGAHEAVLQMDCKLVLAAALLSALWTSDTEIAVLIVLVELRLAGEDALAAFALEMI